MTAGADRQRAYRQRRYAEGKHYIRGRLTDRPYKNRRPGEEPPHGTTARYRWPKDPCHCPECRRAIADAAPALYHRKAK